MLVVGLAGGMFVPRKPSYDFSSIRECLCRSQLLDQALGRRPVAHALREVPVGSLAPLCVEMNRFCLERAGLQSIQQLSHQTSVIEIIFSPFIGGDVLLFLELSRLYKCLEAVVEVLVIAFQSSGSDGGLILAFLRSIKGECLIESSELEDPGRIEMALDAFLGVPHVLETSHRNFEGLRLPVFVV